MGIGTSAPLTWLHVVSEVDNTSGLRFGKLTASSSPLHGASTFLTVNNSGEVVLGRQPANSLRLQTSSTDQWPDYVFEKSYPLLPLNQLKAYIDTHKHLPSIPSTKQMMESGASVEDLIKGLIKTQEEHMRYLLELRDKNDQHQKLMKDFIKKGDK